MGKHGTGESADTTHMLAMFVTGAGLTSVVTGAVAWLAVKAQIAGEKIVVPESAERFAGRIVTGPLTAYEEANTIKRIALEATGGRTYGELAADDPDAETARDASVLRASLFTSILAFGIAAFQVGVGGVLVSIGVALGRLARRSPGARERPHGARRLRPPTRGCRLSGRRGSRRRRR